MKCKYASLEGYVIGGVIQRKTTVIGGKPVPAPFYPPQIPN
jgi:hypothetical protein